MHVGKFCWIFGASKMRSNNDVNNKEKDKVHNEERSAIYSYIHKDAIASEREKRKS